jgi:hypothetical protein
MTDFSKLARDFEHEYGAMIRRSTHQFRRPKTISWTWLEDPETIDHDPYEKLNAIEIIMPEKKLESLLESQTSYMMDQEREERILREQYPALKSAWDQYQLILELVK